MSSPYPYTFNNKYFNQKLSLCLETNALILKKSSYSPEEKLNLAESFHGMLKLTDGSVLFDLSKHQKTFVFGHNSPLQIKSESLQFESEELVTKSILEEINQLWKTTYRDIRISHGIKPTYDFSSLQNAAFFKEKLYLKNTATLDIVINGLPITFGHQKTEKPEKIDTRELYFLWSTLRLLTTLPWENAPIFDYLSKFEKLGPEIKKNNLELTLKLKKELTLNDFLAHGIFIEKDQIQKKVVTFFFPLTLRTNQLDKIFAILGQVHSN